MRVRSLLAAFGVATLFAGFTVTPAVAGTGSSQWCSDGAGWREIPILTSPVTIGLEISYAPLNDQAILVCYSTTAEGQPGLVTGGVLILDLFTTVSTAYPGAYVGITCVPDYATGIGPACSLADSADLALTDASVTAPPSSLCLVSSGSGCLAYLPGVKVVTGGDPSRALIQLRVLSQPVDVDAPPRCVAIIVTCP